MRWFAWAGVVLVLIGGATYALLHAQKEGNTFMEDTDE